ncbi:MAG: hypothetical protein V4850_04860 [Myxococcota bacterium]
MLLLAVQLVVHFAYGADPTACVIPLGLSDPPAVAAGVPPFADGATVRVRGCGIEAEHATVNTVAERDRLWTSYVAWLERMGFTAARSEHEAPWNEVRWQRFERDGRAVELQVRRPGHSDSWMVMLVPKQTGSPW